MSGVSRLGIPVGFEEATTQEIWDFLQQPNVNPQWTFITDQQDIQQRLINWQQLHYSQAADTPFATKTWYDRINPIDLPDEAILEILHGKHKNDPSLHIESKKLLESISSHIIPQMPKAETEITVNKFQYFYSKTRERTSSSPSGLHLVHWNAAAQNNELTEVLFSIISIEVTNAYTLKLWLFVIGCLLEKVTGCPYIHKFRTIHVIESELNWVMRMLWGKEIMSWAEVHKALHNNQYGGRKGCQPQSAGLNNTLTMDVIRYYAEDAALCDKDAAACYERIVPVLLDYALLRLGLPI